MYAKIVLLAVAAAVISGCSSTPTPQNPDEYRAVISKGTFGTKVDTYTVKSPYSKVAKVLQDKTKECLPAKVAEKSCTAGVCKAFKSIYKPTLLKSSNKTELHVQYEREPDDGIYLGGKPPADGMYVIVADAVPDGPKATKMTVYAPTMYFVHMPAAVKHWVNGTNLGCPDFTSR